MKTDILKLLLDDDAHIEQMEIEKQKLAVLEKIEYDAAPDDDYYVVNLDLNNLYDNTKVFVAEGMLNAYNITIPPQSIDYWIELKSGQDVKVTAGDAYVLDNHAFNSIKISTETTYNSTMQIYVGGKKYTPPTID